MKCTYCDKKLSNDEIALTKKMLGRRSEQFMCLVCLADWLGCAEDDLITKIEEFKDQGCTLFR